MKIGCLEISSWVGIGIGAEHIYGKVNGERLSRPYGEKDAKDMSIKDGRRRYYHPEDETERFNNEGQMFPYAIEEAKKQGIEVLLVGNPVYIEPKKIIYTADHIELPIEELNKMADDYAKLDWRTQEAEQDELSNKWYAIVDPTYVTE